MSAKLLNAKDVRASLIKKTQDAADRLIAYDTQPVLAIIRIGEDPGSISYEKSIIQTMRDAHVSVFSVILPQGSSEGELISVIEEMNADPTVHGILVFQPLPEGMNLNRVQRAVAPEKDVDCMNPANLGRMMVGDPTAFAPCTPEGVMELLDYYQIPVKGKDVVVINNSDVFGKPLSILLTNAYATVSICHVFTEDLSSYTKKADIIITGAGVSGLLKAEMIKDGAVVIDIAIAFKKDDNGAFLLDENGKKVRTGDCDPSIAEKASAVTSATPGLGGGTGPLTSAILAQHIVKAAGAVKH